MATIKSFTSLEQSKVLAKILPLESADMYYWCADHYPKEDWIIEVGSPDDNYECICAWSLAALLGVLPEIQGDKPIIALYDNYITYPHMSDLHTKAGNLVDACVDMIIRLNKLNLL